MSMGSQKSQTQLKRLNHNNVEFRVMLFVESFFSKKYCSTFKIHILHHAYWASLMAQTVKNLPEVQET